MTELRAPHKPRDNKQRGCRMVQVYLYSSRSELGVGQGDWSIGKLLA